MHRTKPDGELAERAFASVYGSRLGRSVLQISCGIMFVEWVDGTGPASGAVYGARAIGKVARQ
jgi:hypothetical protein